MICICVVLDTSSLLIKMVHAKIGSEHIRITRLIHLDGKCRM